MRGVTTRLGSVLTFSSAAVCALLFCAPAMAGQVAGAGELIGTVLVDGGESFALFNRGSEFWKAREGEELADGSRLVQIQSDRIVVEQMGNRREILLFTFVGAPGRSGAPGAAIPSPSARRSETTAQPSPQGPEARGGKSRARSGATRTPVASDSGEE